MHEIIEILFRRCRQAGMLDAGEQDKMRQFLFPPLAVRMLVINMAQRFGRNPVDRRRAAALLDALEQGGNLRLQQNGTGTRCLRHDPHLARRLAGKMAGNNRPQALLTIKTESGRRTCVISAFGH